MRARRWRGRSCVLTMTGALLTAALAQGPAGADPRPELVRMDTSLPDYSSCFGGPEGRAEQDSEIEPHVAVSPVDPDHLVAAWHQNRVAGPSGGAQTIRVGVSRDGGRRWTAAPVQGVSSCVGGEHDLVSDPWVAMGADGTVHLATLVFPDRYLAGGAAGFDCAVQVSRSNDGGLTWEEPVVVQPLDGSYHDRPTVSVDPRDPNRLVAAWQTHQPPYFEQTTTFMSESLDGGRTWSARRVVASSTPMFMEHATTLLPQHDGSLLSISMHFNASSYVPEIPDVESEYRSRRSTDGGRTWSLPQRIGTTLLAYPQDPDDEGRPNLSVLANQAVATGPDGSTYVSWIDVRSVRSSTVYVRRTTDGGRSWESPHVVAQVDTQAWLPAVAVDEQGRVAVSWYDARNDRPADREFTADAWWAVSDDRPGWQQVHLAGPFDATKAPLKGLPTQGDYRGAVAVRHGFVTVLSLTGGLAQDGTSDMYAAHLKLPGSSRR